MLQVTSFVYHGELLLQHSDELRRAWLKKCKILNFVPADELVGTTGLELAPLREDSYRLSRDALHICAVRLFAGVVLESLLDNTTFRALLPSVIFVSQRRRQQLQV